MIPDELKGLIEDFNTSLKTSGSPYEQKQTPEKFKSKEELLAAMGMKPKVTSREEFLKWRQGLIDMK